MLKRVIVPITIILILYRSVNVYSVRNANVYETLDSIIFSYQATQNNEYGAANSSQITSESASFYLPFCGVTAGLSLDVFVTKQWMVFCCLSASVT